jgi:hypothetical protein
MTEHLRQLPYVDAVTVQESEQSSFIVVQSPRGAEAVPDLLAVFDGALIHKVAVREPTLEDAYVRLVEGPNGAGPK